MSRRSLNDYQRGHPVLKRIELWLHRRMNAVLANSRTVLGQLAEEGVPRDRLGLIYNGIDVAAYSSLQIKTASRRALHIDDDALVITMVANLIAYKGHRDLLQSLAIVSSQLPADWVLLCVGRDEGIGSALRDLQDELGIGKHVRWLGERTDVATLLSLTDIGVLCSHQEGFSNTVLEGMAAGLPMIVTDVGGNKEAVIDGVTGLVVLPGNPEGLGNAISKLAGDPGLRKQMGSAGRERAQQVFPISRCAVSYARLYRGLLERKPYPVEEFLRRPS
jgi:glycosyltransferase involved in cell wall biosynthesis